MATVAAAAARHNAALLVPKVGFFLFFRLQNPRIRVSFCPIFHETHNEIRFIEIS